MRCGRGRRAVEGAKGELSRDLCRCEVIQADAYQKFTDLIDLYQGKKMHAKALKMLHEYVDRSYRWRASS